MNSVSDSNGTAKSATFQGTGSPAARPPADPGKPGGAAEGASGPEAEPPIHFALRADGAVLLNAADLEGFDLSGREVFTGVVLTPQEMRFALLRLANTSAEAASGLLSSLMKSLSRKSS
jgi:hypothetical protein